MKCKNTFCFNYDPRENNNCLEFLDECIQGCKPYHQYKQYCFDQANKPKFQNKLMILNLTQHKVTQDQLNSGAVDIDPIEQEVLRELLTFDNMPSESLMQKRAYHIATLVKNHYSSYTHAMIGGEPFFMRYLESALRTIDVKPLYAFSKRVVVETVQPDGQAVKTSIFKHEGFVEA